MVEIAPDGKPLRASGDEDVPREGEALEDQTSAAGHGARLTAARVKEDCVLARWTRRLQAATESSGDRNAGGPECLGFSSAESHPRLEVRPAVTTYDGNPGPVSEVASSSEATTRGQRSGRLCCLRQRAAEIPQSKEARGESFVGTPRRECNWTRGASSGVRVNRVKSSVVPVAGSPRCVESVIVSLRNCGFIERGLECSCNEPNTCRMGSCETADSDRRLRAVRVPFSPLKYDTPGHCDAECDVPRDIEPKMMQRSENGKSMQVHIGTQQWR